MEGLCFSPGLDFIFVFRSKGQMQATFLRHEGFLGALGALMSYKELGIEDIEMVDVHLNDKVSLITN